MLVIRLSRKGRRNHPMYRIQVAENSMPTDGKFVEIVGSYNPTATDQPLEVKKERVEHWIKQGAQPSNTVARLLNKVGFNLPVDQKNKAPKKKAVAKSEAAKVAPAPAEVIPEGKDETNKEPQEEILNQVQDDGNEAVETAETPPVEVEAVVSAEESDNGKDAESSSA